METVQISTYEQQSEDYSRVEKAIRFLQENFQRQPELKEVAASVGLSEYHFQRLFSRWVGISPKRFLQYLTKEYARGLLRESQSLLDATYDSGLSGPGRLHDLFVATEGVTPGEYKSEGEGLVIRYGFHPTPFGECLLARTERGVCNLIFTKEGGRETARAELHAAWPRADLREDPTATRPLLAQIFRHGNLSGERLPLVLHGTNFQIKVWEALLRIPSGSVVTYEDIALAIGMPKAARAVGTAVGSNPLPVIIPCHRVIRKDGEFGGYRYGTARKKALLGWEMAQKEKQHSPPES
jgi:AraC family transcriptional regulator of adaptative response/methylated-DNA-[protein]-cysteine methyltransferase